MSRAPDRRRTKVEEVSRCRTQAVEPDGAGLGAPSGPNNDGNLLVSPEATTLEPPRTRRPWGLRSSQVCFPRCSYVQFLAFSPCFRRRTRDDQITVSATGSAGLHPD